MTTFRPKRLSFVFLVILTFGALARVSAATEFNLETATATDIQRAMDRGALTSEQLVNLSLARIKAYEPNLNAIITLNPDALDEARHLDRERRSKGPRSPLHGVPIVVKDCINTYDLPTSLGFFGLKESVPYSDAEVIAKLRRAGAIILAKVNLSELVSGPTMSSVTGQTHNPHNLAYGPAGSSSGTAVGVAAGYATMGIGTDTTGSVRWPSATNGVVGLKPTTGTISGVGVLPTEPTMDTVGPIARTVSDVAMLYCLLNQSNPRIPVDYTKTLRTNALKGMRIGYLHKDFSGNDPQVDAVISAAVEKLKAQGATIVEVDLPFSLPLLGDLTGAIYRAESRPSIDGYLADLRPGFPRSLAAIYAMSSAVTVPTSACPFPNPDRLPGYRDQLSGPSINDPIYVAARDQGRAFVKASMQGIVDRYKLDAIVYPTSDQTIDRIGVPSKRPPRGHWGNVGESIASLTGWPDLTVPAGLTADGLPVGLSFTAPEFTDMKLLGLGFAFEQATHLLREPASTPELPGEQFTY
jgi:amidase